MENFCQQGVHSKNLVDKYRSSSREDTTNLQSMLLEHAQAKSEAIQSTIHSLRMALTIKGFTVEVSLQGKQFGVVKERVKRSSTDGQQKKDKKTTDTWERAV